MAPALPPIRRDPAMPPIVDVRGKEAYQFDERGYVPATLAATIICVRRAAQPRSLAQRTIRREELVVDAQGEAGALGTMLKEKDSLVFESHLELLVAQSTVVNYYRSTDPDDLELMRYAGEWKLAGGGQEEGETLEQTAVRELREEYRIQGEPEVALRPLGARQTRWIRGKSNLM